MRRVTVSQISLEELEQWIRLYETGQDLSYTPISPKDLRSLLRSMPGSQLLMAYSRGIPVAACRVTRTETRDTLICDFSIRHGEEQEARSLVCRVMERARDEGSRRVKMWISDNNEELGDIAASFDMEVYDIRTLLELSCPRREDEAGRSTTLLTRHNNSVRLESKLDEGQIPLPYLLEISRYGYVNQFETTLRGNVHLDIFTSKRRRGDAWLIVGHRGPETSRCAEVSKEDVVDVVHELARLGVRKIRCHTHTDHSLKGPLTDAGFETVTNTFLVGLELL
ncbi:MAG: hypothetical protein QXS20_01465 [Candidatus Thorarchaeota archaeon]